MTPKTISASCSDELLSEMVAEHCASLLLYPERREPPMSRQETPEPWCYRDKAGRFYVGEPYSVRPNDSGLTWGYMWARPKFATSVNAVLPLCKPYNVFIQKDETGCITQIWIGRDDTGDWVGSDPDMARSICFALLKANGWTVEG